MGVARPVRLEKAGIGGEHDVLEICATVEAAVQLARAKRDAAPPSVMTPMPTGVS